MSKKVLVIGGTYFAGRVFAMVAAREADFSLTLLNRGRYSMSHLPNVREFRCDRHDAQALRALPAEEYDAIVDFCAYSAEDVRTLLTALPGKYGRYILLSTADVYERAGEGVRSESTPILTEQEAGPVGDYIFGKVQAEKAAKEFCAEKSIPLTVLRPAFIYGPYNYAPRESYFIRKILSGESLPIPSDAKGQFQFVYVKDVAAAIIACVNSTEAAEAYTLAAPEVMTYESFIELLRTVSDRPFSVTPIAVMDVITLNMPLPFPLFPEENELFDGSRISRELGLCYTPLAGGMEKAFRAIRSTIENT